MTSYGSMPPTEISQFSAFSTPPSAVSAVSARSAFAPSGFSSSAAPSAASESAFSGFSAGGDTAVSESRPNYSSSSKYSQPGFTYPNSSVAPTGRRHPKLRDMHSEADLRANWEFYRLRGEGDLSLEAYGDLTDKTTVLAPIEDD